jgi:putative FmdB family regulatory protein
MPFYEYECTSCKFYTEVLQKVSEPPLKKCPSCKKSTMKKLVSAPVFRLKGGGWYETDFKSDKEGRRNLAVDKEPAANDSTMESKPAAETKATDTKAADSKPESKPVESKADSSASASSASGSRTRRSASAASRGKPKPKSKARAPSKHK